MRRLVDAAQQQDLYFDGCSTVVTAKGPGGLDLAGGMTVDVWIAPYAYEHGIDGKPQARVNQHDPGARTGFLLGLRRFGQIVFQLGFGTDLAEVTGAPDRPAAKGRWSHVAATYDPPRPADVDALPHHDFATGDLTGWTVVSGTAFSDANVTTRTDWGWGGPFYQAETQDDPAGHHLWGFSPSAGGDGATAVLRSTPVVLGGDGVIDLLVSAGDDPDRLYAAVVRADDGKVLAKATGRGTEQYRRVVLDLSAHIGDRIHIEVVDRADGGWGHINVADVNVPVRRS
ncbi:hypothetical protein [Streptomyces sp. NPDC006134]|uniref:hypothetical protein n=1 Tax=Streptomyces sp. NPDC006134 TaxID=3154467 RepID=UPI0033E6D669